MNSNPDRATSVDSRASLDRHASDVQSVPVIRPGMKTSIPETRPTGLGRQNPVQLGGIQQDHGLDNDRSTDGARLTFPPEKRTLASPRAKPRRNRLQRASGTDQGFPARETDELLVAKHSPAGTSRDDSLGATPPEFGQPLHPDRESKDSTLADQGSAKEWTNELQALIDVVASEVAQLAPPASPASPASDKENQDYEAELQNYIANHVYLRMLYFIAGPRERTLEPIPSLEPADQEFWQQMFWAIANYFDTQGMPNSRNRASQTIAQLKSAVARLKEKAGLQLGNLAFCQKISSYGNYQRFKRDEFSPGQPVLLYAEVDNFTSEPTSDGRYRTILKSTIEIFKAGRNGDLVERISFPTTEDLCRNQRRDYFHSYTFDIPPRISLGPHVLKLTVEDQLSEKLTTYKLNFTVE